MKDIFTFCFFMIFICYIPFNLKKMKALINYLNHYISALKRFYHWITDQQLVLIPREEGDMYSIPEFKKRSRPLVELENFFYEWYVWLRPRVKVRLKRY